jgi:hypothetical protein
MTKIFLHDWDTRSINLSTKKETQISYLTIVSRIALCTLKNATFPNCTTTSNKNTIFFVGKSFKYEKCSSVRKFPSCPRRAIFSWNPKLRFSFKNIFLKAGYQCYKILLALKKRVWREIPVFLVSKTNYIYDILSELSILAHTTEHM